MSKMQQSLEKKTKVVFLLENFAKKGIIPLKI